MKFDDFRQYQAKPNHNVFVFLCDDDLLIEESRDVWRQAFSGNWVFEKLVIREFEDIPESRLMDEARTPSLFSQSRALIVTNAEKVTKGRLETLTELHAVPNSSLKVVLVSAGGKSLEAVSRTFPAITIDPLRAGDVARWLIQRHQLTPDTARYLVETLGTDLRQLDTEVEKLKTYTGGTRPVEARDVDVLILGSEQFGPFELEDAVIARDYRKAVQVVGAMLEDGGEPVMALGKIVRVWRQLFIGRAIAGKKSARDVAALAGVPPFKANEFLTGCRKHEGRRLAAGFRHLLQADRHFKTSSADPEVYFDVLLWKLIG